ncbi:MAG: NADH-quinone oxidoreductase subunit L [Bryobacteraceae bacterium]|nr:NADH-quinone oxidoreductase subunit L [Bryobacteraceae bacterium]
MEHASQQLWLIPALPLLGFLINGLFGRRLPNMMVSLVAVGSVVASFLWVLKTLQALGPIEHAHVEHYFTWIESGSLNIGVDLMVDRLTAVMLLVVTGIGALIHIYATGYMSHEGGFYRFFAYLNLFMFFMLTLVLGANYLLMFVGWEGVGLCSYLLIGFYILKKSAGDAAKKAFIVNRIGDFGFTLAAFIMFAQFGSLDFKIVFDKVAPMPVEQSAGWLTWIALLLFVGAAGKSAQIPLYVWLPDAMEGPTPVSALIHAATMVTAGVYMVARSAVIYTHAPSIMDLVAVVGLLTAVMAATIGLTQFDIKKVFAYSTVSQLGYMFLACGVGAFSAGIYHVVTHAFFKALLFLGAGSVIHALEGEQDMRHMGGLMKKIPITFTVLACAWVAIAGVPPFAGFYSKDEILLAAHHHHPWMYWVGVVTAGMTAFYVSRAMFMTFWGKYRGHHHHPHESPFVMWGPLAVLALLSVGGGWYFQVPHYLEPLFPLAEGGHDSMLVMISVAAGAIGIGLAYLFYVLSPGLPDSIAGSLGGLYKLVYNKYFVDEAYDAVIVNPMVNGSRSVLWRFFDAGVIDGAVNGVGTLSRTVGGVLRLFQSGNIRSYAAWVTLGCVAVLVAMGMAGGAR